jgi:hypothetical protein
MTPEPNPLQVLHRDLSTQSQLGMLMSVSATMMTFIRASEKAEDDYDLEPQHSEATIAAETTLILACERIDSIIAEDKRWGLEFQTHLEALFEKNTELARDVAAKQAKLIEESLERERAQKEAAILSQKPHIVFRPTLVSMPDHTWVAYLGDPADMSSGILGNGLSPEAALESFDLVFSGRRTQEQPQSLKNEYEALDQARTEHTGEPDQRGEDLPRDSESPGAQPGLS